MYEDYMAAMKRAQMNRRNRMLQRRNQMAQGNAYGQYGMGNPMNREQYLNRVPRGTMPEMTTDPVAPLQQMGNQQSNFPQMGNQMNGGGQDLQPLDRNPYSPTGGNGFNLNNMLRRKRPTYY